MEETWVKGRDIILLPLLWIKYHKNIFKYTQLFDSVDSVVDSVSFVVLLQIIYLLYDL